MPRHHPPDILPVPFEESNQASGMQFGRAVVTVAANRALSLPLAFLTLAIISNTLSTPEFATFGVCFSSVSFLALISTLGFPVSIIRFVGEARIAGDWRNARATIRWALLASLLASIAIVIPGAGIGWSMGWPSENTAILLAAASFWLVALTINRITSETLRALGDIRWASLLNGFGQFGGLANTIILATTVAIVAWCGYLTVATTLLLCALAFATSAFLGLLHIRPLVPRVSPAVATPVSRITMLRTNLPLLGSQLMQYLSTPEAAVLIAASLLPADDVAHFFVGVRLLAIVSAATVTINQASSELIVRLNAKRDKQGLEYILRSGASACTAVAAVTTLGVSLLTPAGLAAIFGQPFHDAYYITLIILASGIINAWGGSAAHTLLLLGYERTVFITQSAFTLFGIALAILAAKYLGTYAFALSGLLVTLATKTGMLTLARYHLGIHCGAFLSVRRCMALAQSIIQHIKSYFR